MIAYKSSQNFYLRDSQHIAIRLFNKGGHTCLFQTVAGQWRVCYDRIDVFVVVQHMHGTSVS